MDRWSQRGDPIRRRRSSDLPDSDIKFPVRALQSLAEFVAKMQP